VPKSADFNKISLRLPRSTSTLVRPLQKAYKLQTQNVWKKYMIDHSPKQLKKNKNEKKFRKTEELQ